MILLELLVLLATGGLAVSGITIRDDRAHFPARSGLLGYHLPGPGSRLFFFVLVFAATAMSGLAKIVTGLVRGVRRLPSSRHLPGDNTDRGH